MSKRGFVQVKKDTPSAASVYADADPPIADDQDRPGWVFSKIPMIAGPTKINWYVGPTPAETIPFDHLSSFWSILTIDDFTDGKSLPWLQVYTKPKGDGQDASWYRSKLDCQIPSLRDLVRAGERVCIWYGKHEPDASYLDGARLIHLDATRTGPVILDTDEIMFMNVATDSAATSVRILVETLAYEVQSHLPQGRVINLHLV